MVRIAKGEIVVDRAEKYGRPDARRRLRLRDIGRFHIHGGRAVAKNPACDTSRRSGRAAYEDRLPIRSAPRSRLRFSGLMKKRTSLRIGCAEIAECQVRNSTARQDRAEEDGDFRAHARASLQSSAGICARARHRPEDDVPISPLQRRAKQMVEDMGEKDEAADESARNAARSDRRDKRIRRHGENSFLDELRTV